MKKMAPRASAPSRIFRQVVVLGFSVAAGFLSEFQVFSSLDGDRLVRLLLWVSVAVVAMSLVSLGTVRLLTSDRWRKKVDATEARLVRTYNRVLDESSLNPVARSH
ncbi:MAG TPA: hypothetical protein VF092_15640 [Longimicrobium sp.]